MHLTSILWSDNIPKNRDQRRRRFTIVRQPRSLDGIRKFDPKRGSKFIYFAHIWMKKNIFLERRHTGLLGYRLIKKVFYDSHVKERAAAELLNSEHSHSHGQNSWR
jgi:hypothetical protein